MTIVRFFSSRLALVRGLPVPIRVAFFVLFAAGFADGVLIPFFALWAQREAGVATAHIGLLLGCYAGGELLATPLLGGIADRWGRRPTLLVSTLGVGLSFASLYLMRGVFASAATLILIGVFECALHPTAFTLIGDVTPADLTHTRFAFARMASAFGAVAGPALGAWLVQKSLGLVFLAAAVPLLLAAVAVAVALPETRRPGSSTQEDDEEENILVLRAAWHDLRLMSLLVPVLFLQVIGSWIEAILPLFATTAGTITPTGIGWLFAYAGVFTVCLQLPILHASRRLAGPSIMLVSGLLLALAFGSLLTVATVPFLVAAVTLVAAAQMLVEPAMQALVHGLAPVHARATYMAAVSVVNDLKDAAGPAIGTYLYAQSARLPWLIGIPAAFVATLALSWTVRQYEATNPPNEASTPRQGSDNPEAGRQ